VLAQRVPFNPLEILWDPHQSIYLLALYLLLALQPAKYRAVIPWFGWVMVVEGLVLLAHGIRLALPPLPFYGDVAASFLGGGGILWFARRAEYVQRAPDAEPHAGGNAISASTSGPRLES
jgi:hypothetical protein